MSKEIQSFKYSGIIDAPRSKSYLQRAIAIASLAKGDSIIHGYTKSNDTDIAIGISKELGAKITLENNRLNISGRSEKANKSLSIYCGEAGLSTRMFSPIAAAFSSEVFINGSGSILVRPMHMVIDALTQLNAEVDSNQSCLPLTIKNGIKGGEIKIDGSESSQLLTGLLIALPLLEDDSVIHVSNLTSIPYAQMTLDIIKEFEIEIRNENFETFYIKGGQQPTAKEYQAEGDWSGASFHVVGAAISGTVELTGLNMNSSQADRAIMDVVELAGAQVDLGSNSITITKGKLECFEFDATQCPDLFPPIAALAACCNGVTQIIGTDRLVHKESNRALTIQSEMKKLGVLVELKGNTMEITGNTIEGGTIDSNNDHRIAMMGAILATVSSKPIVIENPDAVNKSYPQFYSDLPA